MIMEQNIFNAVYKVNHAGGSGSCFYLKNYDLFVTNYHVVDGFREVALQDNDKNRFYARVVLVNPAKDIAFLKAETEDQRGRLPVRDAVHGNRGNRVVPKAVD